MASDEETEEILGESEETCDIYKEHLQLLQAVTSRNCSMVHELVHNRGMSPDFNVDGQSPICCAAKMGFVDILDILVEGGCSLLVTDADIWRRQALHVAASKGHIDFVKRLLHYGADINSRDDDQRTPLHWASTYGNVDMVRYLISEGAAVNMAQCDGFTPLHAATCLGHHGVCKLLLDKGAEIDRCDRDGWSAFHTAVCYGHKNVVQTLLDAGASVTKLTSDNESVVHISASSGRVEILKLLLNRGVNLDEPNRDGNTALYLAVFYNEFEMVRFLIKSGADMYINRINYNYPLYLAATRGYTDHLLLFIEAGFNFSRINWLHTAVFPGLLSRNLKMCQLLFRKAKNPLSLKDTCKFKIRKCVKYDEQFDTRLKGLNLPALLEEFVSYKVMDSIQPLLDRQL